MHEGPGSTSITRKSLYLRVSVTKVQLSASGVAIEAGETHAQMLEWTLELNVGYLIASSSVLRRTVIRQELVSLTKPAFECDRKCG